LVEAISWREINNPAQWPEDLRWALAEYRRQSDGHKDAGINNAASPRFIVTHRQKVIHWSFGYPTGWIEYAKPFINRLVGPEYARG